MVLQRWDPRFDLGRMHRNMDRFWRGFPHSSAYINGRDGTKWSIPLDAYEEGDNLVVRASLPGVNPEDIEVTVEDRILTISGSTKVDESQDESQDQDGYLLRERRTGSFSRTVRLPETVDATKGDPHYENGILTITLPKVEAKKAKHLTVTTEKALDSSEK